MTSDWQTCPNCGERYDANGPYTSPANRELDRAWWREHLSGNCEESTDA